MAEQKPTERPRELPLWRQRWRWFWARRSGARTVAALALALLALLAAAYLALPTPAQQVVTQTLSAAAQSLGATGLRVALECALLACALGSVALLFAPGARYRRYFTLPSAEVARVAVYLDAENVNEQRHIQAVVSRLRSEYAGQPLELLFFAQLADSRRGGLHRKLYLHGFRPVQVPHDPTGTNRIEEAVDKELAMHALQRALLGPAQQTFILIAKDGGYVPLVYRLTALGHKVEVWSPDPINAYHIAQSYLNITLIDLAKDLAKAAKTPATESGGAAAHAVAEPSAVQPKAPPKATLGTKVVLSPAPTVVFSLDGQRLLYNAIYASVELVKWIASRYDAAPDRRAKLNAALGNELKPLLRSVGYEGAGSSATWLRQLIAANALAAVDNDIPVPGSAEPRDAAVNLHTLAVVAAQAASAAAQGQSDRPVAMQDISSHVPTTAPLATQNPLRITNTRFDIRCARALGLLDFEDSRTSVDVIIGPRLTTLAERIIAEQVAQAPAQAEG